jgi:hypothetical protein
MEFGTLEEVAPKHLPYLDNNYITESKVNFAYGFVSLTLYHEVEELDWFDKFSKEESNKIAS